MSYDHRHPKWPEEMSAAGWRFVQEHRAIMSFFFYVTHLATAADEKARIAVTALYRDIDNEPEKYAESMKDIEDHGAIRSLRALHRALFLEVTICRFVDNFLVYVAELLALIFTTRPETLRSSETVRVDFVLKHSTMDNLITELADRRVNQLSYQGMRDLAGDLREKMGFLLFPDEVALENAIRLIETRNIVVHNRGIINRVYLERVRASPSQLGQKLDLDVAQCLNDSDFIANSVIDIDARSVEKFNLSKANRPTTFRSDKPFLASGGSLPSRPG